LNDTEPRRRHAFLAIICRSRFGYWPRGAVDEWATQQFDLLAAGHRSFDMVADEALGAWHRSDPGWGRDEIRRLWGPGWGRGRENGVLQIGRETEAATNWLPAYRRARER
jgi:hypothetical protein